MTNQVMDEQMIARALAPFMVRGLEGCSAAYDYPLLPAKEKARIDAAARAAYSVIAGKVAEQVGTVNNAWLQWKAGELTAEEALTALFDQIVCPPLAALAPYPERRSESKKK